MSLLAHSAHTVRQATVLAYADFRSFYSWRTWFGGWLLRLLSQVAFFSLIANLVGDKDYVTFVVLGAAMMICAMEPMMAVATATLDRRTFGTLPLLSAAPIQPGFFYFGRSLQWPVSAVGTTSIALAVMSLFFDISWSAAQVPILVLLVGVNAFAGYSVAMLCGAVALVADEARNVISNVVILLSTALCGAYVPVSFWPDPVQAVAQGLPVTHGLEAVRRLQSAEATVAVAAPAALAIVLELAWFSIAFLAFRMIFVWSRKGKALIG